MVHHLFRWYVVASVLSVLIGIVVLAGNHWHDSIMAHDDLIFNENEYITQWVLIVVSGVFFTIGSMAFLRAVNDPPMSPMFPSYYHVCTDELVGAWCFVGATLPFLPYAFLYLNANSYSTFYFLMMAMSIMAVLASFIFLYTCYPSDAERTPVILPMINAMNVGHICCSQRLMEKHLANDWLALTWIIFWVTALGTLLSLAGFIDTLLYGKGLYQFIYGAS